jgi:hypothetical protein
MQNCLLFDEVKKSKEFFPFRGIFSRALQQCPASDHRVLTRNLLQLGQNRRRQEQKRSAKALLGKKLEKHIYFKF